MKPSGVWEYFGIRLRERLNLEMTVRVNKAVISRVGGNPGKASD